MTKNLVTTVLVFLTCSSLGFCQTDEKAGSDKKDEKEQKFNVADGELYFVAPATWKKIKPKFDFYHAEFQIPKAEGDDKNGRITFSQVGGSIEANLDRWIGQFRNVSDENLKRESKTVEGKKMQILHLKGTFVDGGNRPFGPKTEREDYVLIGAAIHMDEGANVYIKAYGPSKTMMANKKHIEKLMADMKVAEN